MLKGPDYVSMDVVQMAAPAVTQSLAPTLTPEQARKRRRRQRRNAKRMTVAIFVVSGLSFTMGLVTLILQPGVVIVVLASLVAMVTAPYAIRQRRILNRLPKLRQAMNQTRLHLDDLVSHNLELRREHEQLLRESNRLQRVQRQFDVEVQRLGVDGEKMRALIHENGTTVRTMMKLANAEKLQKLFRSILLSDRDGDHEISEAELDEVMMRLQAVKGRIPLNTEKLRAQFRQASSNSIGTMFNLAKAQDEEDELEEDPLWDLMVAA